ncbi:immunoglobulin lambda-1 light chain-like [Lacerta agilis]|uniref:immunoglobulin lambda-1 light chain-like n=1 Tax=Lacerta agilis TaxID=80427 RepID=UPI00141A1C00|nr:immunoglobulin lambda-1 light chain-like [Lacerta agilis]
MAWDLFLVTILVSIIGPSVQQLQTLKDPEFVAPGGTVTMSCRFDSGNIGDGNYPWWAQKKPGSKPQLIMHTTSTRLSDVPARFSGSRSGNMMSLTITGALVEDEAAYYCCVWTGSQWIFGGGTQLTVTGQPTVPPTVNVFPPSQAELRSSDKATLVCLIDGFYPGSAQVTWLADGTTISSGVETTKPTKLNDKYAASSYLSMGKSDWERYDLFTCKVAHEGKTFEKQVRRSECA